MKSAVTVLDSFLESAYELPKESARKVFKTLRNLVSDPQSTGLHIERLSGRGAGLWSVRVDDDYRIILRKPDQGHPTIMFVGKHDSAYRYAERVTRSELGQQPGDFVPSLEDRSVLYQQLPETLNPLEIMRARLVGEGRSGSIPIEDLELVVRTHKYVGLSRILLQEMKSNARYSFHQIELAIDDKLPPSARKHPAWWANESGAARHSQARSWLSVGWRVDAVDIDDEEVRFAKG